MGCGASATLGATQPHKPAYLTEKQNLIIRSPAANRSPISKTQILKSTKSQHKHPQVPLPDIFTLLDLPPTPSRQPFSNRVIKVKTSKTISINPECSLTPEKADKSTL